TALVAREVWDAAQQMGRRHGSARDPETPTTPQAIRDLLTDPRADQNQQPPDPVPTRPDQVSRATGPTRSSPRIKRRAVRELGAVPGFDDPAGDRDRGR